ncbi:tetratricopeptide repeat protein [Sphingomonas alpina]|uniref:Tetratricopeptide repeat protein n=1 Tax=Sphingomonas alpina TaxID=653931 RepID=A0A7H0LFA2_9SPHN|nr:tetratricopeptide repeat protein [Sphingomonas alpina]QNQ08355.1 tetratricopeptide repeat protein [Sphingomonas alpina]
MVVEDRQELNAAAYALIVHLCARGDQLARDGVFDEAVDEYNKALALVPEPKEGWNATTWILIAIGDACFRAGDDEAALEALEDAVICPGGLGNPFLHLRYGQVLLNLGHDDHAADELMRAYIGGGEEIYASEDPRYRAFLKTRAILPDLEGDRAGGD